MRLKNVRYAVVVDGEVIEDDLASVEAASDAIEERFDNGDYETDYVTVEVWKYEVLDVTVEKSVVRVTIKES